MKRWRCDNTSAALERKRIPPATARLRLLVNCARPHQPL
jgi:hypothetical protein